MPDGEKSECLDISVESSACSSALYRVLNLTEIWLFEPFHSSRLMGHFHDFYPGNDNCNGNDNGNDNDTGPILVGKSDRGKWK